MFLVITLGGLSFLLALLFTPIIRGSIGHHGFLDRPDGVRKKHSAPIPKIGGIAIALSYASAYAVALFLPFSYTHILHESLSSIWRLMLPASVVLLTGVLDDLVGLNAWKKLTGIFAACALALLLGLRVEIHSASSFQQPWVNAIVTVIWLVGCTNAFNLIDGMDGLAAGIGLLATVAMMVAGLTQGNLPLVLATLPLAGCLVGFLVYNFNPASVFLGDSGSLLLGFLLGCYGALWSEKSVTLVAMVAPLLAVSVPMLDVMLSILRRFLRNRPIFTGDRGHIHHKLLDRGLSPKGVVLTIYGFAAVAAALSLLAGALHNQFSGLIVILFCTCAWVGVKHLRYPEFKTAGEIFFRGGFRRIIDAEARLAELEEKLLSATDLNECWNRILAGSREFGFKGVRMSVCGSIFQDSEDHDIAPLWQLRIPLSSTQYINFFRDFNTSVDPGVLCGFVRCIEVGLKDKIGVFVPDATRKPVVIETLAHSLGGSERASIVQPAVTDERGHSAAHA